MIITSTEYILFWGCWSILYTLVNVNFVSDSIQFWPWQVWCVSPPWAWTNSQPQGGGWWVWSSLLKNDLMELTIVSNRKSPTRRSTWGHFCTACSLDWGCLCQGAALFAFLVILHFILSFSHVTPGACYTNYIRGVEPFFHHGIMHLLFIYPRKCDTLSILQCWLELSLVLKWLSVFPQNYQYRIASLYYCPVFAVPACTRAIGCPPALWDPILPLTWLRAWSPLAAENLNLGAVIVLSVTCPSVRPARIILSVGSNKVRFWTSRETETVHVTSGLRQQLYYTVTLLQERISVDSCLYELLEMRLVVRAQCRWPMGMRRLFSLWDPNALKFGPD